MCYSLYPDPSFVREGQLSFGGRPMLSTSTARARSRTGVGTPSKLDPRRTRHRTCLKSDGTSVSDSDPTPRITNQHASARESNIQTNMVASPPRPKEIFYNPWEHLQGEDGRPCAVLPCSAGAQTSSTPATRTARITNAITTLRTPENTFIPT